MIDVSFSLLFFMTRLCVWAEIKLPDLNDHYDDDDDDDDVMHTVNMYRRPTRGSCDPSASPSATKLLYILMFIFLR